MFSAKFNKLTEDQIDIRSFFFSVAPPRRRPDGRFGRGHSATNALSELSQFGELGQTKHSIPELCVSSLELAYWFFEFPKTAGGHLTHFFVRADFLRSYPNGQ